MIVRIKKTASAIRASSLWVRAVRAFENQDDGLALELIARIAKLVDLLPHNYAFLGQIHVHRSEVDLAIQNFAKAMEETSALKNNYERYVFDYSSIFLKIIETQEVPHELISEARKIPVSASMKRWLPLSKEDLG